MNANQNQTATGKPARTLKLTVEVSLFNPYCYWTGTFAQFAKSVTPAAAQQAWVALKKTGRFDHPFGWTLSTGKHELGLRPMSAIIVANRIGGAR